MPGIIIGAIISFIIAYFFFTVSIRSKRPVFSYSDPVLIAKVSGDDSLLQIMWDKTPLENIVKLEIVLWNDGNLCIDQDDFLDEIHLNIKPSEKIDILKVFQKSISRKNLNVDISIIETDSIESIGLDIQNAEVLEKDDGILLHVL